MYGFAGRAALFLTVALSVVLLDANAHAIAAAGKQREQRDEGVATVQDQLALLSATADAAARDLAAASGRVARLSAALADTRARHPRAAPGPLVLDLRGYSAVAALMRAQSTAGGATEARLRRALAAAVTARGNARERWRAATAGFGQAGARYAQVLYLRNRLDGNPSSPSPARIQQGLAAAAPSARARTAVAFALAQVGKPYVFGAVGPGAFDCSGLTMASWAAAGVRLPHYSFSQSRRGQRVDYKNLEPGDLIFLYSDWHHVEIYLGDGLAISAPQEGENVKIIELKDYRTDFVGGARLG